MNKRYCCLLAIFFACTSIAQLPWPKVTSTSKPWTRWWWQGSAVNKEDLESQLRDFRDAGLGGIEITPIYGVVGEEKNYIPFLSPRWMEMLMHTLKTSRSLGLGADMANGTGWPFGGPWVTNEQASVTLFHKVYTLKQGSHLQEKIRYKQSAFVRTANNKALRVEQIQQPIQTNPAMQQLSIDQVQFDSLIAPFLVMAYGPGSETINLNSKIDTAGILNWEAPKGQWKVIALFKGLHGKMVERAAPGGEGYALDHFSDIATREYLKKFDTAFKNYDLSYLRAFFNDSYEVDDARGQSNWTNKFLREFSERKGYDLSLHLEALLAIDSGAKHSRVLYDYRTLIDELLLEHFTRYWKQWAGKRGAMVRNQSHGSPANTLDLYGAVDIPETEGNDILRFKFASSAGNLMGKPLVSAEAATWLDEHFLSNWADVKKAADLFFLGGVNHIFYHGTAYSPKSAAWPGWLFYAAVHFQPTNPMWKHFSTLNDYITRVQSFLQSSRPDNDLLVYYPIGDQYAKPGKVMLQHFDGMERNFINTDFLHTSEWMLENDYTFDFFSGRQLQNFTFKQKLNTGGNSYNAILVPAAQYMEPGELLNLLQLAKAGATVLFYKQLPVDVPGLYLYNERKSALDSLKLALKFNHDKMVNIARIGAGRIITGDEIGSLLSSAGIRREQLRSKGISFLRKRNADGNLYFLNNTSGKTFRDWISVANDSLVANMATFNPVTGQSGLTLQRKNANGKQAYYIHLEPGESVIIQTYLKAINASPYVYYEQAGATTGLKGTWTTRFMEGGPIIPRSFTSAGPKDWTLSSDSDAVSFSGMAVYTTDFKSPSPAARYWKLDLGKVFETAEIILNGKKIATLIGPVYHVILPQSAFTTNNKLEVIVANKMANRIRYMDLHKIPWKYYYNINMPARKKENSLDGLFDASKWQPVPSGLVGPVTLTPMKIVSN